MRKLKKRFALGLVLSMLVTVGGCGESEQKETQKKEVSETIEVSEEVVNELEWLNTGAGIPIVKEGTDKTLSIYVLQNTDVGDPNESWLNAFIENALNIDVEWTSFTGSNQSEFISLAFASGELPDIIIGGGFSVNDLLKYGLEEGQLLDMAPYINELYMPNINTLFQEYDSLKNNMTDSEGHVWSLGYFNNPEERGNIAKALSCGML